MKLWRIALGLDRIHCVHNITKTLLALFVFCAFSLVALPQPAFALDNDDLGDEFFCSIVINGTTASRVNRAGETPVAYPIRRVDGWGNDFSWGHIQITLSPAAAAEYERCGGELVLAAHQTTQVWDWFNHDLTPISPYTTVNEWVRGKNPNTTSVHSYEFDVEIKNNSGSVCPPVDGKPKPICKRAYIHIASNRIENQEMSCQEEVAAYRSALGDFLQSSSMATGQEISFSLPDFQGVAAGCSANAVSIKVTYNNSGEILTPKNETFGDGVGQFQYSPQWVGQYTLELKILQRLNTGTGPVTIDTLTKNFCVHRPGEECTPRGDDSDGSSQGPFNLCKQIPAITDQQISQVVKEASGWIDKVQLYIEMLQRRERLIKEKQQCCACSGGTYDSSKNECNLPTKEEGFDPTNQGLYTAIGCIPSTSEGIVTQLVKIGLGIAGGVALLMILAGSFMLSTSQGEPKRAGEAKEMITSAVMGLLFVIFSVTILQFIGVTILRIPGFGSP